MTAEPQPTTLQRQVARAVRWNALVPVRIIVGSAATLVLGNSLSRDALGLYTLILVLTGLLGTWIDFGVERSLPKFYPEVERDSGRAGLRRFVRQLALFKLGIMAVLVIGLVLLHDWFLAEGLRRASEASVRQLLVERSWWLLIAVILLLALGAIYDVLMQILVAYFRQKQFNLISLLIAVVQPLLIILAVMLGYGPLGIVVALVLAPVVAIGLAWSAAQDALAQAGQAVGAGLRPDFYRRLTTYSLTNYGQQLATMLHSFQFAALFAGSLAATADLRFGYFTASQLLQIIYAPLNGLLIPLFARLREEQAGEQTAATYGHLSRFTLVLFLPAAAGLVVLAPNLTNLLWPQLTASAPIAAVMAVCLFGASMVATARSILMVHEIYRPLIAGRLVGAISIPLLLWLSPLYGSLGVAIAIGSAGLAAEIVSWLWALRVLGLRYPWLFAGRTLLATLIMVAVIWPLAAWVLPVGDGLSLWERLGPALAGQALIVGAGASVYLVSLRLLGGLSTADKDALRTLRLPGTRLLLRVF